MHYTGKFRDSLAQDGTFLLRFGGENRGAPTFSQPSIQVMHMDEKKEDAKFSLRVQIPADSQAATFGLLLQSAQASGEVRAELQGNATPASLASRKSSRGLWYRLGAESGARSHALEFTLHLPAGQPARPGISGWLRVRRKLAAKKLVLQFQSGQEARALAGDPLPVSSETERKTDRVFDEDLR